MATRALFDARSLSVCGCVGADGSTATSRAARPRPGDAGEMVEFLGILA